MDIYSADYSLREYELTPRELRRAMQRVDRELEKDRRAGRIKQGIPPRRASKDRAI